MPVLTWPTKSLTEPQAADLHLEAITYPQGAGYPHLAPEHHLFFGDNLSIMAALLERYEGQIDLIYADPPFFTNRHYPVRIGRGEDSRQPHTWQLAPGYADHWETLDAYLDFLYPRLALMRRLLSPRGTLYVHLDWHASACVRLLLDELFGPERFLNEIIWLYHGPSPIRRAFNRKHDTILAYTKSKRYIFNADAVRVPYNQVTVQTFESSPRAGFGKVPNLERGKVPEDWWYFPVVARLHRERTGYPTQKPEALLERVILASSEPGSLVADFFCGSGTFPFVAARLGRRALACDSTWRAVHTTRVRLVEGVRQPFALWRAAGHSIPTSSTGLSFTLTNAPLLSLHASSLALDYWEVDPAWDGKTFRSAAQAWRPPRQNAIPLEIPLPFHSNKVCLRAVTVEGQQIEVGATESSI